MDYIIFTEIVFSKCVTFYIIPLKFIFNALLSESKLLRSKYLTEQMISDVGELDKYEKKARVILSKYEKAKFYQIVA